MKKILQNLVLTLQEGKTGALYLRTNETTAPCAGGLLLTGNVERNQEAVFNFDTYFNAFSLAAWKRYAHVGPLELELEIQGKAKLSLVGANRANQETQLLCTEVLAPEQKTIEIPVPPSNDTLLFFRLQTDSCRLFGGRWLTEISTGDIRSVHLSVGICTYRRESFVRATVARIQSLQEHYPELHGKIMIHVADNGNTLSPKDLPGDNIFLHPNPNAGGSGGFSRCMIETLEQSIPSTHMLLMDDDVDLEPESLFRTISLLELLKASYQKHVVAGAMLSRNERFKQSAREEQFFPMAPLHRNLRPDVDISLRSELLVNDGTIPQKKLYAAWWYCAFPLEMLNNGLPLPLFFQFDDIEFALRNNAAPIHLNGISVWHEPFWTKRNSSKEYYVSRNRLIVTAVCGSRTWITLLVTLLRFMENLLAFDYTTARYILAGLNAYLDGPSALPGQHRWTERPQIQSWEQKIEKIPAPAPSALPTSKYYRWFKRILALFTLNGHLLPSCLLASSIPIQGPLHDHLDEICLKHTLFLRNANGLVCRRISRREAASCLLALFRPLIRFAFTNQRVTQAWRGARKELTSKAWWKKQLR